MREKKGKIDFLMGCMLVIIVLYLYLISSDMCCVEFQMFFGFVVCKFQIWGEIVLQQFLFLLVLGMFYRIIFCVIELEKVIFGINKNVQKKKNVF